MNMPSEQEKGKGVLEKRARLLAVPPQEDVAGETLRLLTFLLGRERYGVDIDLVRETQPLEDRNWSPVPCTPDFIFGAVNMRGRIYPVIDVSRFLGLPSRPKPENAHVMLVTNGGGRGEEMELSLLADDLPHVAHVPVNDLKSPPVTITKRAQEFMRGVTDDMIIILDLKRLLEDPEIIINEEV